MKKLILYIFGIRKRWCIICHSITNNSKSLFRNCYKCHKCGYYDIDKKDVKHYIKIKY